MIINPSKNREEYFNMPDSAEILHFLFGNEFGRNIYVRNFKSIDPNKLVVCTKDGSLDNLLNLNYELDSLSMIEKIKNAESNQLIILPSDYLFNEDLSRPSVAKNFNSLLYLDKKSVKEELISGKIPSKLSRRLREKYQWEPEKVISTLFNQLNAKKEKYIDRNYFAYYWNGLNGERRIVSPYECVRGEELLVFSDYAELKHEIILLKSSLKQKQLPVLEKGLLIQEKYKLQDKLNVLNKYIKSDNDFKPDGRKFTRPEMNQISSKIDVLVNYLKKYGVYDVVMNQLKTKVTDILDIPYRSDNSDLITMRDFKALSRSRPNASHILRLNGLPITPINNDLAYSQVWELRSKSVIENSYYGTDRRKRSPYFGQDEILFPAAEIAYFHKLRRYYENNSELEVRFNPFVFLTSESMKFIDNLRYNAVVLFQNFETDNWSKRELNALELSSMLIKKGIADGYDSSFTTDIVKLRKNMDIRSELIKFR